MNPFNITANQCFFFGSAPSFNFVFPLKSLWIRFYNFTPHKLNRSTIKCVRLWMRARLMLVEATIQFSG